MGKHAENWSFRRAQTPAHTALERFNTAYESSVHVLGEDYTSLLPQTDAQSPDDSQRLVRDFPLVSDQCQLIAKLGARMLDWKVPGGAAPVRPIDSRTLPAGYTYFGQFVAHDISFAADRFPRRGGTAPSPSRSNLRSSSLCLETIYGSGPKHFPLAYVCQAGRTGSGPQAAERIHLRLGLTRSSGGPQMPDLPRLSCPELGRMDGISGTQARGATDVLIPDGRNDDHALISQLTTLFIRSHNHITDKILDGFSTPLTDFDYYQVFERSRTANVHIYQTIIWNDYLRRILDPAVFARYAPLRGETNNTLDFVTSPNIDRLPVEFSHAAFRFGHAMVRSAYRLGISKPFELDTILEHSSAVRPDLMPFDGSWLIDWRRFFNGRAGDSTAEFMFSRPLGPSITPMGPDTTFLVAGDRGDQVLSISVTKSGQTIPAGGIATRDLARGYSVPMAPVADIIAVMRRDGALRAIVDAHPLLANRSRRAEEICAWLDAPGIGGVLKDVAFSNAEMTFLSEHPPLFFFVLFEAEQLGGGTRLGPVGSFIVAETLFARLVAGPGVATLTVGQRYSSQALVSPPATVSVDVRNAFDGIIPATMNDLVQHLPS